MIYEYCTERIEHQYDNDPEIRRVVNKKQSVGWRCIGIIASQASNGLYLTFERPLSTDGWTMAEYPEER